MTMTCNNCAFWHYQAFTIDGKRVGICRDYQDEQRHVFVTNEFHVYEDRTCSDWKAKRIIITKG